MYKIVILTDESGLDRKRIERLNLIFPECEIEIKPAHVQTKNDSSSHPKKEKRDILDEKIDKLMSFL